MESKVNRGRTPLTMIVALALLISGFLGLGGTVAHAEDRAPSIVAPSGPVLLTDLNEGRVEVELVNWEKPTEAWLEYLHPETGKWTVAGKVSPEGKVSVSNPLSVTGPVEFRVDYTFLDGTVWISELIGFTMTLTEEAPEPAPLPELTAPSGPILKSDLAEGKVDVELTNVTTQGSAADLFIIIDGVEQRLGTVSVGNDTSVGTLNVLSWNRSTITDLADGTYEFIARFGLDRGETHDVRFTLDLIDEIVEPEPTPDPVVIAPSEPVTRAEINDGLVDVVLEHNTTQGAAAELFVQDADGNLIRLGTISVGNDVAVGTLSVVSWSRSDVEALADGPHTFVARFAGDAGEPDIDVPFTLVIASDEPPVECAVSIATAGRKVVGQTSYAWGTAQDCVEETVTLEVLVDGEWEAVGTAPIGDNGFYKVELAGPAAEVGVHQVRVTVGDAVSAEATFERFDGATFHVEEWTKTGESVSVTGTAAPGAQVVTQIRLSDGRWARSQATVAGSDGTFSLPLTYGANSHGTLQWKLVVVH